MLFDKRKPSQIVEQLNHESKITAIAWSPSEANLICSVGEGGRALIWDLNDSYSTVIEDGEALAHDGTFRTNYSQSRQPKSQYMT